MAERTDCRVITGRRYRRWQVNGVPVTAKVFVDMLEQAGVDIRDADALALMGASDLEYWRAIARACAWVGLEFHVDTVGGGGLPERLV